MLISIPSGIDKKFNLDMRKTAELETDHTLVKETTGRYKRAVVTVVCVIAITNRNQNRQ